jgi:hypothetical protein
MAIPGDCGIPSWKLLKPSYQIAVKDQGSSAHLLRRQCACLDGRVQARLAATGDDEGSWDSVG